MTDRNIGNIDNKTAFEVATQCIEQMSNMQRATIINHTIQMMNSLGCHFYDDDNPDHYISELVYNENEDKMYVVFKEKESTWGKR